MISRLNQSRDKMYWRTYQPLRVVYQRNLLRQVRHHIVFNSLEYWSLTPVFWSKNIMFLNWGNGLHSKPNCFPSFGLGTEQWDNSTFWYRKTFKSSFMWHRNNHGMFFFWPFTLFFLKESLATYSLAQICLIISLVLVNFLRSILQLQII